jgi:hypothetical protein
MKGIKDEAIDYSITDNIGISRASKKRKKTKLKI